MQASLKCLVSQNLTFQRHDRRYTDKLLSVNIDDCTFLIVDKLKLILAITVTGNIRIRSRHDGEVRDPRPQSNGNRHIVHVQLLVYLFRDSGADFHEDRNQQ